MHIIDSADGTRAVVQSALAESGYFQSQEIPSPQSPPVQPEIHVYATDSIERFQHLGSRFLDRPLPPVQLVDLGG